MIRLRCLAVPPNRQFLFMVVKGNVSILSFTGKKKRKLVEGATAKQIL
jgi:hypothetical protein